MGDVVKFPSKDMDVDDILDNAEDLIQIACSEEGYMAISVDCDNMETAEDLLMEALEIVREMRRDAKH
jgi:hypothetical protein